MSKWASVRLSKRFYLAGRICRPREENASQTQTRRAYAVSVEVTRSQLRVGGRRVAILTRPCQKSDVHRVAGC